MQKLILWLAAIPIFFFSFGCASHIFRVKVDQKTVDSKNTMITYTFFRLFPRMAKLDVEEMCRNGKVKEITLYDSGLDGLVCGVTILMYCPKTIQVSCYE